MSTFNYSNLQSTANRLLAQFGNNCKITYAASNGGGNASASCVMTSPNKRDLQSTTITASSKIALVSGSLKKAPGPGDQLVFGKTTYMVTAASDTTPDGATTCLYRLEVATA